MSRTRTKEEGKYRVILEMGDERSCGMGVEDMNNRVLLVLVLVLVAPGRLARIGLSHQAQSRGNT